MRFSRGTYSNALDLTLICQSGSTEIVSEKCLIHRNCEEKERAPSAQQISVCGCLMGGPHQLLAGEEVVVVNHN